MIGETMMDKIIMIANEKFYRDLEANKPRKRIKHFTNVEQQTKRQKRRLRGRRSEIQHRAFATFDQSSGKANS
jgi:hypothetical protein